MKKERDSAFHWINGLAAAGLILLASGTAVAAGEVIAVADEPDGKQDTMVIKVIRKDGKDGHGAHADAKADVKCAGDPDAINTVTETTDADGKKRVSRIVMCRKSGGGAVDKATLARRLEEAKARIAENKDLSDETRAKVLEALDGEIVRLKATN